MSKRIIPETLTLDEFGCWLNTWGDDDLHLNEQSPEWMRGYHEATFDAYKRFTKIVPFNPEAWRAWKALPRKDEAA